jgi:hypothetical protein
MNRPIEFVIPDSSKLVQKSDIMVSGGSVLKAVPKFMEAKKITS